MEDIWQVQTRYPGIWTTGFPAFGQRSSLPFTQGTMGKTTNYSNQ
jgi:hypothetical protein